MLGLRGCRLGIIYPEITAMQVRAIFEAACTVAPAQGAGDAGGDDPARRAAWSSSGSRRFIVRQVAEEVFRERQITVPFLLGTMIELPRAASPPTRWRARRSSSPSAPTTSPRPPGA